MVWFLVFMILNGKMKDGLSIKMLTLKECFKDMKHLEEDTVFFNDGNYCDTINFLQNVRFKVSNEKLNAISLEKRKEMVKSIHQYLDELEQLTEPLWGYSAENDGWNAALDFILAHCDTENIDRN